VAVLAIDHRELRAETIEIDLDVDTKVAREQFRPGVEWFSVYAESGKVGYLRNERVANEDGSFAFRTRSELHENPIGEGPLTFEVSAKLDDQLALVSFEGKVDAGLVNVEAHAAVQGDKLEGQLEGLGISATPFSFPLDQRPAFDQSLRPLLLQRDLQPGQRYEFSVLDPLTMQTRPTIITYEGVEQLDIMGAQRKAHHLAQDIAGQRLHVWVNDLGEVLSEELPGGFKAVRETEAEALWGLDKRATVEAQAAVKAEAERRRRWKNPKRAPRGAPELSAQEPSHD
jgi:hypothetical protein